MNALDIINSQPKAEFVYDEQINDITEKGDVARVSIMRDYRVKKYVMVASGKINVALPKECKSLAGAQRVAGNAIFQNFLSERAIEHLQHFLRKYEDMLREVVEDKEQLEKDFAEFWDDYERIKGLK